MLWRVYRQGTGNVPCDVLHPDTARDDPASGRATDDARSRRPGDRQSPQQQEPVPGVC